MRIPLGKSNHMSAADASRVILFESVALGHDDWYDGL